MAVKILGTGPEAPGWQCRSLRYLTAPDLQPEEAVGPGRLFSWQFCLGLGWQPSSSDKGGWYRGVVSVRDTYDVHMQRAPARPLIEVAVDTPSDRWHRGLPGT